MHGDYDLRILFPTSFSDSCFQVGRAIAQLADTCRISLTLAHIVRYGGATAQVHRELDSFLGEADHFDHCRRVLIESDNVPAAVADFASRERFDLVISPASDRLGVSSLVTPSFRARLLARSQVPLWTMGHSVPPARFRKGIKNVACLVDFDKDPMGRMPRVTSFAERFGARLHLLDVIPPVSEGTVVHALNSERPLRPEVSLGRIREMFDGRSCPNAYAAIGHRGRELRRMLEACEADILFVGHRQAERGVIMARYARDLDRLPCPVICLSESPDAPSQWSFERIDTDRRERFATELAFAG